MGDDLAPKPPVPEPVAEDPEADVDLGLDGDADDEAGDDEIEGAAGAAPDQAYAHRAAATSARLRLQTKRTKELEAELAVLRENQLTDDDVAEYNRAVATAEEARRETAKTNRALEAHAHYTKSWQEAAAKARREGADPPPFDADSYVQEVLQRDAASSSQLTAEAVAGIVRSEIGRATKEGRAEFERGTSERAKAEQRAKFIDELKVEAKKDAIVKVLARGILSDWEASGRKGTASSYVKRLTAPQRKVAGLAASGRAAHARTALPLQTGAGAPAPRRNADPRSIVETEGWDVAETLRAISDGRLPLK